MNRVTALAPSGSRPGRLRVGLVGALLALLVAGCSGGGNTPTGAGGGSAAAGADTSPGAPSQPALMRKIKVAHAFISAETLPIWVALDQKLFEKYGLQVEAVPLQTSAQVAPAMTSGDVQIALTTGTGELEFNLSGGDHVIVAGYSNDMRYFLMAKPDVRRVEELRGKKVGITRRGGAIDIAAHIFAERHGMEYGRDVAIIELGTAQNQVAGLVAGSVDAAIVALPTNLLAEREGFHVVEDTKQLGVKNPTNVIAVRRGYLQSNRDVVRDYLKAHIEAVERARKDKALAVRLLGQGTNTDDKDLLEKSYDLWLQDLQDVPYPSPEAIQGALDSIALEKPDAKNHKPNEFYDDTVVRELDQAGFIKGLRGS
jgi:ABC-type nitrate/sulfonate/bicarbonate transport system substrate-binding protein